MIGLAVPEGFHNSGRVYNFGFNLWINMIFASFLDGLSNFNKQRTDVIVALLY